MPYFSVLIASYNNAKYIDEAIDAVFKQTFTDWEIIIVDDESSDSTKEILKKYEGNPKIRIFHNEKNIGCGATKRLLAELAEGQIMAFLDSDDVITPESLEVLSKMHKENPNTSIVHSDLYYCDENLNIKHKAQWTGQIPIGKTNFETNQISHFASFKTNLYRKTVGISPNLPKAVDKDLYLKMEEVGPTLYIDKPLYYYRVHSGGISRFGQRQEAMVWFIRVLLKAIERRKHETEKQVSYKKAVYSNFKKYCEFGMKEAMENRDAKKWFSFFWLRIAGNPFKVFKPYE